MDRDAYVDCLELQGRRLVELAAGADLGRPVPSCPGWSLADLLRHVAYVHTWATGYVANAWTEMVEGDAEAELLAGEAGGEHLVEHAAAAHLALVGALRAAPEDLACWSFLPATSPLLFWARRQAHETAVHRVDAELAVGAQVTAMPAELAVDGLDELLLGFMARRSRRPAPGSAAAGTIALLAADRPDRWRVELSLDGMKTSRWEEEGAAPDLTLRGSASDLYYLMWNRRSPSGLDLTGREELLELWAQQARVRWS